MPPLFAESADWITGAGIGGIVVAVGGLLLQFYDKKSKNISDKEEKSLAAAWQFVTRLETEIKEIKADKAEKEAVYEKDRQIARQEYDQLAKDNFACEKRGAQQEIRIAYMEEALRSAGLRIPTFPVPGGSEVHHLTDPRPEDKK